MSVVYLTTEKDDETHVLEQAFCFNFCKEVWRNNENPTTWAQNHTLTTGHPTGIDHRLEWTERITSVSEEPA